MPKLNKKHTATLRKMAKGKEIPNWENLERPELLAALSAEPEPVVPEPSEPKEEEKVDLEGMTKKDLKALAKKRKVDVKGLKTNKQLITALEVKEEKKEESSEVVSSGVVEEHVPAGGKVARMKARLAKQPKVRILIPLRDEENRGTTMSVILNGYRLNIVKGQYVNVPEQVADIVMKSQNQTISIADDLKRLEDGKPIEITPGSSPELE